MKESLGSLIRLHYGKALKTEERDNSGGVPVFGSNGLVGTHTNALFLGESVVIGRKGSVGKITYAPSGGWVIDTAFFVEIIAPKRLSPRYLFHALNALNLQDRAITTSIPGISRDDIYCQKIPFPLFNEQRRIAATLDKADAVRRKRQEALKLADALVKSQFIEMFGDPVTNPMGWEVGALGDFCEVGSSKRVFVSEFVEQGIPFYRGTEVTALSTGKDVKPSLFITLEHYDSLAQHTGVPQIGDLLMPSICSDGQIWRVKDNSPFYFKDGRVLWVHRSMSNMNSIYLQMALRNKIVADYHNIASGTTFAELKIFSLKSVKLPLPPISLQNQFARFVEQADKSKLAMQRQLEEAEASKSALMQQFFN